MSYHRFVCQNCKGLPRGEDGALCDVCEGESEWGSFQVFFVDPEDEPWAKGEDDGMKEPGWYWWACFPGCMPDSDAIGPFPTEEAAFRAAQREDE